MISAQRGPQLLDHLQKSLTCTIYSTKWIPGTARFVAAGQTASSKGCLQVYELNGHVLKQTKDVAKEAGFKCCSFGCSTSSEAHLATGSWDGKLAVWDLEHTAQPLWEIQAHASIVNSLAAFGGQVAGFGPPEVVTCGRDGAVRVWDVRQRDAPSAAFEPADVAGARDCWCVAIGNSHNEQERCILAGYDNGDIKMFDLRTNKVRWEINVGNGVCGLEFDRPDIPMNKFVATCLEGKFVVFDARTQHPKQGFASRKQTLESAKGSTLWGVHHLPQNRDVCAITGGGTLHLCRYKYPDQRKVKDQDGQELGVAGDMGEAVWKEVSSQPILGFDWSADKEGLFVCSALDQCLRVGIATKTNTL